MLKQVEIKGQSFELYSADQGRTWSSSARSLVAYERRKKTARSKLQESFQHISEMQDADPDKFKWKLPIPQRRALELEMTRLMKTEFAMNQRNAIPGQKMISPQGGIMKMRRQTKRNAEVKLFLIPCLCDLNEIRAWTQASTASKSPR